MADDAPLIIHVPQSLTGDGHDAWTDVRMEPITAAIIDAGYMWASSTDTADRFGNQVELDNYLALHDWVMEHFGSNRDVYLFGTSMGTMACISRSSQAILRRAYSDSGFSSGTSSVTGRRHGLR